MAEHVERIFIGEAAEMLDRKITTLRKWEQLGVLPKHLMPHRTDRGWRYYTPDQIEGIKKWIKDTDRRPGKGLKHYKPDQKKVKAQIHAMRKPRKRPAPAST
jgi:hypothetical protein